MTSDKLVVQRTTSFHYWSGPFLSLTGLYTPYTKAGLTLSSFNTLVLCAAEKGYVMRFRKRIELIFIIYILFRDSPSNVENLGACSKRLHEIQLRTFMLVKRDS